MQLDSTFFGLGDLPTTSPSVRALRAVLAFGCLALALVWAIEAAAGLLLARDAWVYPLLLGVLGLCLVDALRARDDALRAKTISSAAVIAYLVTSWHLTVFDGSAPLDMYRVTAILCWLGLVHAGLFVFFDQRAALSSSLTVYMGTFAPIGLAMAVAPPLHWPAPFTLLSVSVALATATSIVLLASVSRLQQEHQVSRSRIRNERRQSMTDALTGLPNRRAVTLALKRLLAGPPGPAPLTVLLIDVDHFKTINDQHGHDAGDVVLIRLGRLLARRLRATDIGGRWGGEEFLALLPATDRAGAIELAERLRASVARHRFPHQVPVTISIGMAQLEPGETQESLLKRADRALYGAKQEGRNRVVLAGLALST